MNTTALTLNLNQIYTNLANSLIALLIIAITYIFCIIIMTRRIEGRRQKRQVKIRAFYIACIIYLFVMARIWVEGFTHLLAVLGLVSAALVVTNKETIMNLVGWLIINWRGLFSEDDLIQIQQYKGYVKAIGFLYFTLLEITDGTNGYITGRVIRIPNGLATNNALVNYSQTSHLLEQKYAITIAQESDIEYTIAFLTKLTDDVLATFYNGSKEFSLEYLSRKNKHLTNKIKLNAKVSLRPKLDKPSGIELTVRYYCFVKDMEAIQYKIWLQLFEAAKKEKKFVIAYSS